MGGSEIEVEWAFYLIPNAYFVAIPAAAGVGEISDVVKIYIQVGLACDPQLPVIILLPDFPVIKLRPGATMNAQGFSAPEETELIGRLAITIRNKTFAMKRGNMFLFNTSLFFNCKL